MIADGSAFPLVYFSSSEGAVEMTVSVGFLLSLSLSLSLSFGGGSSLADEWVSF